MQILSSILVLLVALEHVYILVLEMFLWTKPQTMKSFGVTPEHAEIMKTLAANQGLYNGFLAAGLGYSLLASNPDVAFTLKIFFLLCVIVAGIYGGVTVKPRIAIVQAVPAAIALVVTLLAGRL
jgi:putative membrane protein